MIGGGSEVDQQGDVEYETDIQDTASTSIGMSLNINFIYSALKVQPFLSFSIHQNEFTMETKYTKISTQDVTILKYENEVKRNLISLGTRFFDPQTQLMSLFSVSYLLSETQTNALTSATVNEAAVSLSNTGSNTFSSGDLSFSIMAGYTF
jgi:hypothetical protein